ncbi:hypothetical protein BHE74_00040424 [Ensete ventricosum]|nr:hypothetical protein BHE74_00040424 [Ensete ventricosum]
MSSCSKLVSPVHRPAIQSLTGIRDTTARLGVLLQPASLENSAAEATAMDVQIAGSSDGHGDVTSVFQSSTGSPEMEFMTNLFEIATLLDLGTDCLE